MRSLCNIHKCSKRSFILQTRCTHLLSIVSAFTNPSLVKNYFQSRRLLSSFYRGTNTISEKKVISSTFLFKKYPSVTYCRNKLQTMSTSVTSEDNDKVDEIRRQKKQLRKTIRSKLRNLKQEDIDKQSNDIWCQLWDMEEYRNATSVGLFLSMPKGEIHTYDACSRVLKDGKQLYVPRVGLDFEACDMDMIQVVSPSSTSSSSGKLFCHDWPRNKWDIPEPPSSGNEDECKVAQPGDIDLLIVPGLAFDKNGGRLGQGKGYYDRFIAKMRLTKESNKKPLLVAVALDPSYVCADIIPTSVHDYPMDMIITATTIIKA